MGTWFCQWSQLNCNDLARAISDIRLQLNVTLVFLVSLLVIGILLSLISRWQSRRKSQIDAIPSSSRPLNHKLRLRAQRGLYAPAKENTITIKEESPSSWWSDFWQGMSTEFFGAVVTTILLGLGVLIFEQYQDIQNRKAELILQMGSPDNSVAIEAVRILRDESWLEDGTLSNAVLWGANLSDADLELANLSNANLGNANLNNTELLYANLGSANLEYADLSDTVLEFANLSNANLWNANLSNTNLADANLSNANLEFANLSNVYSLSADLSNANLWSADLSNANLRSANLSDAYLWNVNLSDAYLWNADFSHSYLRDANLSSANLSSANLSDAYLWNVNLSDADLGGANLSGAIFNEATILPDGTQWTPDKDMTRFTDYEHPNFWNPCVEVDPHPQYCSG